MGTIIEEDEMKVGSVVRLATNNGPLMVIDSIHEVEDDDDKPLVTVWATWFSEHHGKFQRDTFHKTSLRVLPSQFQSRPAEAKSVNVNVSGDEPNPKWLVEERAVQFAQSSKLNGGAK